MNPGKRHLFFRLLRVFKTEYIILSFMIIIQVVAAFASPLGVKNLLEYDIFSLVSHFLLTDVLQLRARLT